MKRVLCRELAVALLVVLALAPAVPGTGAFTARGASDCSTTVVHDAFRFNEELINATADGAGESISDNTRVRIEQDTGFVRLNATNPNGYCVAFEVHIDRQVVSPAELGEIEAINSNTTADWRAVHDFKRDETYTSVEFTIGPDSSARFAPSQIRVKSLAWTGKAEAKGSSMFDRLSNFSIGDEPKLEKKTYTFSPSDNDTSSIVTVPLENTSDGRTVTDWQAMYRTPSSDWQPVEQDGNAPVFYRTVDDNQVQFIFNDKSAEVEFVAEPDWSDEAQYQWRGYTSGWDKLTSLGNVTSFFGSTAVGPGGVAT